jgi:hypothetical protein
MRCKILYKISTSLVGIIIKIVYSRRVYRGDGEKKILTWGYMKLLVENTDIGLYEIVSSKY